MSSLPLNLNDVHTWPELLAWRAQATPTARPIASSIRRSRYGAVGPGSRRRPMRRWAQAPSTWQLERGARVAILLPNGMEAVCIDQACLSLACVPVPLHAIDNPPAWLTSLRTARCRCWWCKTCCSGQAIAGVGEALPGLAGRGRDRQRPRWPKSRRHGGGGAAVALCKTGWRESVASSAKSAGPQADDLPPSSTPQVPRASPRGDAHASQCVVEREGGSCRKSRPHPAMSSCRSCLCPSFL